MDTLRTRLLTYQVGYMHQPYKYIHTYAYIAHHAISTHTKGLLGDTCSRLHGTPQAHHQFVFLLYKRFRPRKIFWVALHARMRISKNAPKCVCTKLIACTNTARPHPHLAKMPWQCNSPHLHGWALPLIPRCEPAYIKVRRPKMKTKGILHKTFVCCYGAYIHGTDAKMLAAENDALKEQHANSGHRTAVDMP